MQLTNDFSTASAAALTRFADHAFWTDEPDQALMDSLAEHGQLNPVLVRDAPDGPTPVAGFARIAALRQTDRPALLRTVVADTPLDRALFYLADNSHRTLDDAMRVAALAHFRPLVDHDRLSTDILPRLGVAPKSKDARLLLTWLDLPETWRDHLAAGRVPLAAGTALIRMAPDDLDAVAPLFAELSWSRSNGVNLLAWLYETGRMRGEPVETVMQHAGMNDLLDGNLSPKDVMRKLVATAHQVRHPHFAALQSRFERTARELTAGTRWRIEQPNHFETGGADLRVQVKTPEELARSVEELETMATQPQWDALWKLGERE